MALLIAQRTFEPRLWSTLLVIALAAVFIALGRWQLSRADYKRALFAEFASGSDATMSLGAAGSKELRRYQHVSAAGEFDDSHQVLLDNMTDGEQAGFRVLTPFLLADGRTVLVDRGWFALGRSRTDWPVLKVAAGPREIRGRIDELPVPGIRISADVSEATPSAWPKLMNFPRLADLELALGRRLYPRIVLLDANQPDGFRRDWTPPGFAPERHIAYAVQWFGMALTLGVLYVIMNLRKQASP
ncbi:MAG TPA: SURF1 family protein [Steroidobacteraceae bacterium]|nr:SURF1 family protein [Steroidobacteraceae bacterium]